ncbi:MAG: type II toxin-antitoxin system VapC family toxin [Gemmataceae bacterium]|nr:type II toxin-antitoxin system VapC family toxin [Gemmataceae bacterium]MCI0739887.1 type II toxin-antitoxin system VapC family toxin [Gemmataceae bacterium]
MKYAVDASVGFKWVVPEADSDKAIRLRDSYLNGLDQIWAPDFYPVEVAHAITRAERQGRITPAEGLVALRDTINALPRLELALPLLPRAYAISSQNRIGVYDCIYVALAEREQCELVTADDKLVKKLQAAFPFVRHLSTLP